MAISEKPYKRLVARPNIRKGQSRRKIVLKESWAKCHTGFEYFLFVFL